MEAISKLVEELIASQQRFCTMDFVCEYLSDSGFQALKA
jgi:hypothetical protein